jgi:hypothetical protein
MADIKRLELSGEYYSHKRSSLLASAIFLALCLPGIKLDDFSFAGVKFEPGSDLLIPAFAGLVAAYYLIHYWFIWSAEAHRHARSAAAEGGEIYELLRAAAQRSADAQSGAISMIENLRHGLTATTDDIGSFDPLWEIADSIQTNDYMAAQGDALAVSLLEGCLLLADGTGNLPLRSDLALGNRSINNGPLKSLRDRIAGVAATQLVNIRKQMLHRALVELKDRRPNLVLLVPPDAYVAALVTAQVPWHIDGMKAATRELRRASRAFQVGQKALWFRTTVLDLWIPIGTFAAAMALFAFTHLPKT